MDAELTPDIMLYAYSVGVFPMAESADSSEVFWCDPNKRGVFPLDGFHVSRSLARRLRKPGLSACLNRDFSATVSACAQREETWINADLHNVYMDLHEKGFAHSFEVFENDTPLGGVFGLTLGGAFFGESMFSAQTNGSKLALAFLTCHLTNCGFTLFDTQFITDHLASLGAIEIPRARYQAALHDALDQQGNITSRALPTADQVLQRTTQTS